MTRHHRTIDAPFGELTLVADDDTLVGVYYSGHWTKPDRSRFGPPDPRALPEAQRQLAEYFAGERTAFTLRTHLQGTPFQRAVWALLQAIPYGATTTYRQLAAALGRPAHARAVGSAVRANPLSVIVPCHRVLGSAGALTGYAGGLERKTFLLELEAAHPAAGARRA